MRVGSLAGMSAPTRLLLIRHGQSTWNEDGRWQGRQDPPLTDLGRDQARHAAGRLGAVDAIWCSTLQRAAETARILADELGVGPVVSHDALVERCAGPWEGLTRREVEALSPGYLADGRRPVGWESDDDLAARVLPALESIAEAHDGGEVAVVTHGGVIYRVEDALGAGFERIANLGGRGITWDGRRFALDDRVDLVFGHDVTVPRAL